MLRSVSLLLFLVVLLFGAGVHAGEDALIRKLKNGVDFRVRVQAALELGKTKSPKARPALEKALGDENAAVRAAAAAALKVLGDRRAVPALKRHQGDASPAVRAQIQNALKALSEQRAARAEKVEVRVEVGRFRNRSGISSRALLRHAEQTSREQLRAMPGVAMANGAQGDAKVPLVLLAGQVKRMEQQLEGAAMTCSASVEFIVHRMPGRSIKGILSGSARVTGAPSEMADLQRTAVEAAIQSAMRKAAAALKAAAE